MYKGIKVRLYPTKEQETLFWKSAGVAKYSYNWALSRYEELKKQGIKISNKELRKEFTLIRKTDIKRSWLKEVSSEISQQAIKDLDTAFKRFFKNIANYPKFKKKGKCEVSFYHLTNKLKVKKKYIYLEKIGWIRMNDENRLPIGNYKKDKIFVSNPRVKHNGKYWYLSLGIEYDNTPIELTNESVGIDLGIKNLAIVSHIDKPFKNINKSKRVKKLNKRLKILQRQVSRKYQKNKQNGKFVKTKNIIKLEKKIKLINKRISDIRLNYIHQTTNTIAKTKPCRIVMEDLNVTGMMKNKHLSKAIQEQCFNKFIILMEYKCNKYGIKFVKADRFYPSSKNCSCCGNKKKDLKLKDRVYVCDKCGLVIDRDKNASINLANYKEN